MLGHGNGGQFTLGQVGPRPAEPITPDKWFAPLSEPVRFPKGLTAAQQQFSALPDPYPFVSFSWFGAMAEPVRLKPGLPTGEQQFLALNLNPITITPFSWFAALSDPVRIKPGLQAGWQQFLAAPSRLLPTPNITGTMTALETKDTFLAGAQHWDRVISGEIGVIEVSFSGGEIGVIEQAASSGTSGVIESAVAPASGSAVSAITAAHVSIRIV